MNLEARCVYENFSWHRQIWTDHKQGAQHGKYPHTLPHMLAYHTTPHTHKLAPVMNKIFWEKIRLPCTLQPSKQLQKVETGSSEYSSDTGRITKKLQMHVKMGLSHWHTQSSVRRLGSLGPLIHSRLWDAIQRPTQHHSTTGVCTEFNKN